jgi:hypothetical protein
MAQEVTYGSSPEEEVRELERKLEEKKRELAKKPAEQPEEKEVFRDVLRGHIEEVRKMPVEGQGGGGAPPVAHRLTDDLKKKADELKKEEEREAQVQRLVDIALTKSLQEAVNVARAATPYLLDELHDHLVDDYYDKLVTLRKVKEL